MPAFVPSTQAQGAHGEGRAPPTRAVGRPVEDSLVEAVHGVEDTRCAEGEHDEAVQVGVEKQCRCCRRLADNTEGNPRCTRGGATWARAGPVAVEEEWDRGEEREEEAQLTRVVIKLAVMGGQLPAGCRSDHRGHERQAPRERRLGVVRGLLPQTPELPQAHDDGQWRTDPPAEQLERIVARECRPRRAARGSPIAYMPHAAMFWCRGGSLRTPTVNTTRSPAAMSANTSWAT